MRWRVAWLASRRWWRWQSAVAAGMLLLGITAVGGWVTSLVDELGDNEAVAALARASDRTAYEAECRFDLAHPVAQLESEQIDLLVDVVLARAAGDAEGVRAVVDRLAALREEKAEALEDREGAVVECDDRARELFGS